MSKVGNATRHWYFYLIDDRVFISDNWSQRQWKAFLIPYPNVILCSSLTRMSWGTRGQRAQTPSHSYPRHPLHARRERNYSEAKWRGERTRRGVGRRRGGGSGDGGGGSGQRRRDPRRLRAPVVRTSSIVASVVPDKWCVLPHFCHYLLLSIAAGSSRWEEEVLAGCRPAHSRRRSRRRDDT